MTALRPNRSSDDAAGVTRMADGKPCGLDTGERAAIHLALALRFPVLMDERLGRQSSYFLSATPVTAVMEEVA
jgi:predicted nucleic acid-binding protein